MKRLRILHETEYLYSSPVSFYPHRIMVRPREGHDVHIESSLLEITPSASVRWIRDVYGNSIAVAEFSEPGNQLLIRSELVVQQFNENPLDFLLDSDAVAYPFQYSMDEQQELVPYRLASYPRETSVVRNWIKQFYRPGQLVETFALLTQLNLGIFHHLEYQRRDELGTQTPATTLEKRSGSCRDYAVLLMEAVRHLGFGARFVTGYLHTPIASASHGATHAWVEIYLPGAGWRGFDPTNGILAGAEYVSVAVTRDPEKASPVSGSFAGPPDAFQKLEIRVDVRAITN